MASTKIDNVATGLVVAFDADTGDVVHIHETLVESVEGAAVKAEPPDAETCESIRCQAAEAHPRRRIDAIAVRAEAGPSEGERLHVDPMTRQLRHLRDAGFADRRS